MEGWKDGRMEGWKGGRMEGWKGIDISIRTQKLNYHINKFDKTIPLMQ